MQILDLMIVIERLMTFAEYICLCTGPALGTPARCETVSLTATPFLLLVLAALFDSRSRSRIDLDEENSSSG